MKKIIISLLAFFLSVTAINALTPAVPTAVDNACAEINIINITFSPKVKGVNAAHDEVSKKFEQILRAAKKVDNKIFVSSFNDSLTALDYNNGDNDKTEYLAYTKLSLTVGDKDKTDKLAALLRDDKDLELQFEKRSSPGNCPK